MTSSYLLSFVVLLVSGLIGTSVSSPAMDNVNKYEEYIIEHELSATQAKNAALSTDLKAIVAPPGCQECTKDEKHYCMSSDLISDHCCCDKRYHEYLPYIPHTCYFGTQLCTTVATDCAKYSRLRSCCCNKYLLQKWKEKYGANNAEPRYKKTTLALLLLTILGVVHIFG